MRILLDTNIILDIILDRKEFVEDSLAVMQKAISNGDRMYLSASSATDIYYIVRKQTGSKEQALNGIKRLAKLLTFADVNEECVLAATLSKINDYEDAVVDEVATRSKVDFIVTRNVNDFKFSKNKVITPKSFIKE